MSDYVYLKNLNGQQIKPVTDLAAINMTTTNGIGVSTVNGGTIGIIDGYIESAYYTEMADPAVGAANVSSAYVDGGTAVAILGAYTVASAVDTAAPSQQKVPSEKAVVDALNNVVVSGVSYYAGTGINIDQGHTVSVANVPQSSVAGLETTLTGINTAVAAKQDAISAGYRMSLDGTTLNQKRYFDIESPTSATITLQAGHAYKITATNSSKTLDSEQIPANQFGLEGHAEIFVAGTGLIKTTSNVVLAQALEPDAVNNCTVRFHDGKAIISVEDHVAGYIVVSASGTTAGTLPYALSTASNEYISFDASLNNMTLDMGGAVTNGEKHVVGNGFSDTILTGGISCTSKTTFANLAMSGVVNSGGTMTLGDVYIPNGATVAVSGGTFRIEKVIGDGGTLDLNGTEIIDHTVNPFMKGIRITGAKGKYYGAVVPNYQSVTLVDCEIVNNSATYAAGAVKVETSGSVFISNCLFSGNYAPYQANAIHGNNIQITGSTIEGNLGAGGVAFKTANASITDTKFGSGQNIYIENGSASFSGSNSFGGTVTGATGGVAYITSGAILDLTGNSNATPIAPGGGITFEPGGATVLYSSGVVSGSYMIDNVTLPAGAKLTNTAVVDLGGEYVFLQNKASVISGATINHGSSADGYRGGADIYRGTCQIIGCLFAENSGNYGGAVSARNSATVLMSNTVASGNIGVNAVYVHGSGTSIELRGCTCNDTIGVQNNGTVIFAEVNNIRLVQPAVVPDPGKVIISSGASINLTSSINPGSTGGITVLTGGCTVNGNAIPAGTYTSIDSNGTPT